ncbi:MULTISPECIES: malto-oligosyltrehalose synthase [unclassified Rhizobium]|uniref:malto-oligosyltrehalose synthase n=1 Tax=unclassified Rhizobium TaxID=2613769 RepID=UPI0006F9A35D|nr:MULTISPECIES: malto-oligosyltrehalose synthase [unclassified Rhizobium]KQV44064.1 malto-oligosyltrehalose synthase [Rhizobium sp. Root1212]KRD38245.1 malto-oligosyltrehalose synthase [Rhizobium sp. Root268]
MQPPVATYRVQFRQGMTFDRTIKNLPHIRSLGISHVYASPIFTATSGSTHGYDVTDANEIDPAIGGRAGFDRFVAGLKEHGLGLILDIVPNHMAASQENAWWWDVMERGRESRFAGYFDIDWNERLTLPHLGKSFAEAVADDELQIERREAGTYTLRYHSARYPLSPESTPWLLEETGGNPGALSAFSRSPEKMAALHGRQHWQLIHWKEAARHLSYRRFFEVTGLVGMRVEDPRIFDESHRLILDLVRNGAVQGLRLDHIDGLADPAGYLKRLREAVGEDVFIVVEKILGPGENPRPEWPVTGTTGYEFIEAASNLFIDRIGLEKLDRHYRGVVPSLGTYEEERRQAKMDMATRNFAGEVSRLAGIAAKLLPKSRHSDLASAICELLVCFPVYRTYGTAEGLSQTDAAILDDVVANAKRWVEDVEAIDAVAGLLRSSASDAAEFRTRFQQLTGPIMAKSMEDTLFYRYNGLIASNEVGGEPGDARGGVDAFHAAMLERMRTQPQGLTATSTHDTKRAEDARARLYTISEDADAWAGHVARWRQMNADLIGRLSDGPAPDPNTEWLLYQALLGALPEEATTERLVGLQTRFSAYALKAIREAKTRTDWAEPDEDYEAAVERYARALLSSDNRDFVDDFISTVRPYIVGGYLNSLTQTLIKIIGPGVPDFYQGTEGFDLSLVDPDNRRPVDYELFEAKDEAEKNPRFQKLNLIKAALKLRRQRQSLFSEGGYLPLHVEGERADHVVAFMRVKRNDYAIAVAPRLMFSLVQPQTLAASRSFWGDTRIIIPASFAGRKQELVNGRRFETGDLPVSAVLRQPVALIVEA